MPVARERRSSFGPKRDKWRCVDERQRQRQDDQRRSDECARRRESLADRTIILAVLVERGWMIDLAKGAELDAGTQAVLKAVSDKTGVTPSTPTAIIFNDDLGW